MSNDDALVRLRAGLDDDERDARACIDDSPHWIGTPDGVDQYETSGGSTLVTGYFNQNRRPLANYHIARHDPSRVADRYVPAIRRVLALYERYADLDVDELSGDDRIRVIAGRETLEGVLEDLASIYAEES